LYYAEGDRPEVEEPYFGPRLTCKTCVDEYWTSFASDIVTCQI